MSRIMLIGEAWGENEERIGQPFVGSSGVELLRMLNEAGVISFSEQDIEDIKSYYRTHNPRLVLNVWQRRNDIITTNVFNLRPASNKIENICGPKKEGIPGYPALIKSKYVLAEYEHHLTRLGDELLQHNPNIVVCLGNTPLWALTGATGITKVRGTTLTSTHIVEGFKLLPTYHPSAILRQYELRPTAIADLMKVEKESGHDGIIRPERQIIIDPGLDDIEQFFNLHCYGPDKCDFLSTDIETAGTRITCIGFAPSPRTALVIPFDDARATEGNYWKNFDDEKRAWNLIRRVLEDQDIKKIFQNGAYDIGFLFKAYGIRVKGAAEDTMLLQHALHPEALKGLGYLGSLYSNEGSWKDMRVKTKTIKRGN